MITRVIIIVEILYVFCSGGWTRTAPSACPVLNVHGPSGIVPENQIARYLAEVDTRGHTLSLTYKWSISSGTIKSGQGTESIEVIQPANCVTVTLEVGGLPDSCPAAFSETSCGLPAPLSEKLGEITGVITKTKLAQIRKSLESYPVKDAVFYIIISGTKSTGSRAKKLASLRSLSLPESLRTTYVISDATDDKVILWAVPPGATPPGVRKR